jgi:hypothetical protein
MPHFVSVLSGLIKKFLIPIVFFKTFSFKVSAQSITT